MPEAYKTDLSTSELNELKRQLALAKKQFEQINDALYDAVVNKLFAGDELSSSQQNLIKLRFDECLKEYEKLLAQEEADLVKKMLQPIDHKEDADQYKQRLYKQWEELHNEYHTNQVNQKNLHDQPRLLEEKERLVKLQVEPTAEQELREHKANYEAFLERRRQLSVLEKQIPKLEERIDAGKPLKDKIVDFNKAIFAYEDGLIVRAKGELNRIETLQQGIDFKFPVSISQNKQLIEECVAGIQRAESLQEMEFYRSSFVRAIDNVNVMVHPDINALVNKFIDLHKPGVADSKELKKERDDLQEKLKEKINGVVYYYDNHIKDNNAKINKVNKDLSKPDLSKDQRAKLEEQRRKYLVRNHQYDFALKQVNQIKNDMQAFANARNDEDKRIALGVLNAHQEQIKQYNDAVYQYKKFIACLCIARSSYLKPGFSLWESLTESDQRKEAYINFLKSFMEETDVAKIQNLADQEASGTSEAVVAFVTDDVKNTLEVVTALPIGVNQVFNIGTFAFDMVNIGAELTEAQGHYAVPVRLGERHHEPVTGWNLGGRLLSLAFGLTGLAASVVLFLGSILPGITTVAAANTFSLSLVALVDTFWGAGNYTLDKIKEWKQNKKVQEQVAKLEVLDDANNQEMLAEHSKSSGASHADEKPLPPGQQQVAGYKPGDGGEAHVFDLLHATPAAPLPSAPPASPSSTSSSDSSQASELSESSRLGELPKPPSPASPTASTGSAASKSSVVSVDSSAHPRRAP